MSQSRLDARILAIGRDILARAYRAEPGPMHRDWWQRQLLEWVMEDDALKVRLFKFIESLPRLSSPEAIAGHLRQYLANGHVHRGPLGSMIELATSYRSTRSMHARAVASAALFGSRQMASTFIAGGTAEEAIAAIRRIRRVHRTFTIDVLGETVLCSSDADKFRNIYLELIDALCESAPRWPHDPLLDDAPFGRIPRVNLSIKLSALTPFFDPLAGDRVFNDVAERVRPVLRKARDRGAFVNVDLEHHAVKDLTYDIFMRILTEDEFRDWPHIGIVSQAYLRESEDDLQKLIDWTRTRGTPITVRLVKGAYWDFETAHSRTQGWPSPVWSEKWQSDHNYERLSRMLIDNHQWTRPAFASHNVRSLAAAIAYAESQGLPHNTLEIQMLFGMGDPLKKALTDLGQRVRVYTPFGDLMNGMAYFIRRLLENTANESFLRQSFGEHTAPEILLATPSPKPRIPMRTPGTPADINQPLPHKPEPLSNFASASARRRLAEAIRDTPRDIAIKSLIGGKLLETSTWHECRNPSRPSEMMCRVAVADSDFAEAAVEAAHRAARSWARTDAAERGKLLRKAADRVRQTRMRHTANLILQMGKTWRDADAEIAAVIDAIESVACRVAADAPHSATEPLTADDPGVVGVFFTFNQALKSPMEMVVVALLAGHSVIVKPGLRSSGVTGAIVEALASELPDGVINTVYGPPEIAEHIASMSQVVANGIVGPPSAVDRVRAASGDDKTVLVDSAQAVTVIVDSDTDFDEAVLGTMATCLAFAGQSSVACNRIITIGDPKPFLSRLAAAARESIVTTADRSESMLSPLIDAHAVRDAEAALVDARAAGSIVAHRNHAELIAATGGHFFGPTVVADLHPAAPLLKSASAAPMMYVINVATLNDALRVARDSRHAMTGLFYSRSPGNIQRIRQEWSVETLFINRKSHAGVLDQRPSGGSAVTVGDEIGGWLTALIHNRPVAV